jgi:YhcH/YjgK/YiaL family protein
MILDTLENAGRYAALHDDFAAAFAFLAQQDLDALEEGRHEIAGDRVFALVMTAEGKPRNAVRLEAHRRYIDIQIPVAGTDVIGWSPLAGCSESSGFDEETDLEFFDDPVAAWIDVPARSFAIFFPEDAHAPCAFEGTLRKIVIKVAVA